jgi:nitroreductase
MSSQADTFLATVLSRRSALRLSEPAPAPAEVEELLQAAATAPDHGRLRPWRLIALAGEERVKLGEVLGEAASTPQLARRAVTKPLRAPLILTIVLSPVTDHPKVPVWEQLAATAAMVSTLSLLLHSRGWGAIWRTGSAIGAPQVLKHLGIVEGEQLLGWLYVGTRPSTETARPREPFEARSKISWFCSPAADGTC